MGHFSSKPCNFEECCAKGEFVPFGCVLAYRIYVDAWFQIRSLSTGNVVVGPYYHTGDDSLYISNPIIGTAGEYLLEIRLQDSTQWIVIDKVDWAPDGGGPSSPCCVEESGLEWYELDELIVSLDTLMEWVGKPISATDFLGAPCTIIPQPQAASLLGTYYLPYTYTDPEGYRRYRFFDTISVTLPSQCFGPPAGIHDYDFQIEVAVNADGKANIAIFGACCFDGISLQYQIYQPMSSDCLDALYLGAFTAQLASRESTGKLPFRQFTIMGRTYLSTELPLTNLGYLAKLPWYFAGPNP